LRSVVVEVQIAAPPRTVWDLYADLRQSTELRSRLPGHLGWLHELASSRVARRGIRQAVTAAKLRLEGR
jgi:hypothetical protein